MLEVCIADNIKVDRSYSESCVLGALPWPWFGRNGQQQQQHQQRPQNNYLSSNYSYQQQTAPSNGINMFQQQHVSSMSFK